MTCPACGNLVPAEPIVLNLALCPSCLASLVIVDGGCRRATGEDTTGLADRDLAALRKARKRLREVA